MRSIIITGALLCAALWGSGNEEPWARLILEGSAHEKLGHYAAAATFYLEAVRLCDHSVGDEKRLALALNSVARTNDELGRYSEAERMYRRALTVLENAGDRESSVYAVLLGNLGSLMVETGRA